MDVAMEGYAFASQMAHKAGELGAVCKVTIYEQTGIYPLLIPPSTLKKYATGQGTRVSKSQILLAVYKKWGVEFSDDNAADSFVLANIAGRIATHEYERDIITRAHADPAKYRETHR